MLFVSMIVSAITTLKWLHSSEVSRSAPWGRFKSVWEGAWNVPRLALAVLHFQQARKNKVQLKRLRLSNRYNYCLLARPTHDIQVLLPGQTPSASKQRKSDGHVEIWNLQAWFNATPNCQRAAEHSARFEPSLPATLLLSKYTWPLSCKPSVTSQIPHCYV